MSGYCESWETFEPTTTVMMEHIAPRRLIPVIPLLTSDHKPTADNNLINGLITPERRTAPVSAGMITKSMDHQKVHDMKHDRFEVVTDNSRQRRLKFNEKRRYANHRPYSFLPQE